MGPEKDPPFDPEADGTWPLVPQGDSAERLANEPILPESKPASHPNEQLSEKSEIKQVFPSGEVPDLDADSIHDRRTDTPVASRPDAPDDVSEFRMTLPPVLEEGRVIFGKYRLIAKIGEGAMGSVWRVQKVGLKRTSALKLIKPEIAQNTIGWQRFEREAQVMAKLNHPNAVAVFEFQRTHGMGYIEMEFVRGRSLADILQERGAQPFPLEWTAQVLEQLCSLLQDVHGHVDEKTGESKPIVHRDLKPANLMLIQREPRGSAPKLKVLDFGIAKMIDEEGKPELTGTGDLLGTPAYMSPEQIEGGLEADGKTHEIDGRSDLYSTGVLLYRLLTGVLPFRGTKMAILAAHLNNAPSAMKQANPHAVVPAPVERVVLQCLEKDPAKRPQAARELCEKFQDAVSARGGSGGNFWSRFLRWIAPFRVD